MIMIYLNNDDDENSNSMISIPVKELQESPLYYNTQCMTTQLNYNDY